jgi:hypothetical protein
MSSHGRVSLGTTFEPFLARCAAVRRLRVIEGMMLQGIRVEKDESMQGLLRKRGRGRY